MNGEDKKIRRILVTGASGGIGSKVCERLVQDDYDVIAVSHKSPESLFPLKSGSLKVLQCDLSNQEGVNALIESRHLQEIHGLIYCAGVAEVSRIGEIKAEELQRMFYLNSIAPILLINHLLKSFMKEGTGRIVLVGSIVADYGGIGLAGYSSSKSALSGLNKSVNREIQVLKRNFPQSDVTVNLVKPGYTKSNMTSLMNEKYAKQIEEASILKRFLFCEEIANEICRLVDRKSSFISGSEIEVNGGQTL